MNLEEKRALVKRLLDEKQRTTIRKSLSFSDLPAFKRLKEQKDDLAALGVQNPYFRSKEGLSGVQIIFNGNNYLNYASYNYLGLSGHPHVNQRVVEAVQTFGSSCSASRIATGEVTLHGQFEERLGRWLGVEKVVIYVGGYGANVSLIGHLMGPKDLILYDEFIHRSCLMGAILSGARRLPFPHMDYQALEELLATWRDQYDHLLIITEGVFSMDGDIPDLPRLVALKKRYRGWLMVDEAHSIGVLGPSGRGIGEHFQQARTDVDIWMGTLSKSFASCGGYIAGSADLIDYLKYSDPGFVYSVGISPVNTAAALGALEIMEREPWRVKELQSKASFFRQCCEEYGFDIGQSKDSAIVPLIVGDSKKALLYSDLLFQRAINVQPIFYPAVEEKKARLRFFITYLHSEEELARTAQLLQEVKLNRS